MPLVLILLISLLPQSLLAQSTADKIKALNDEKNIAIAHVNAIVNQPVQALPFVEGYETGSVPFWFHDGAITPDFNTVDVRKTQENPYKRYPFVMSDQNPKVMFATDKLEFNSMTKYFYQDRTLPKKRLSEVDMLAINENYRVIGRCNAELAKLQGK